jgi:N utilization substance protein B
MSKRHTGRKLAMLVLYQADIQGTDVSEVLSSFLDPTAYIEETKNWVHTLAFGVETHQDELDALITRYAIGWELSRIAPVDRNILRIAFYELLYEKGHPRVVINEALEVAKKYATDDSPKFINGILGMYIKDHPFTET